ncbi:TIGR02391 family protein [Leifsonia sp. P73]|uniref:TIGR02391 family protein n=1 Tax=Leifsonia sp. P73 TaxID=3423959 RepID=UPI003DA65E8C
MDEAAREAVIALARSIQSEVVEYSTLDVQSRDPEVPDSEPILGPESHLLAQFDERIKDDVLRIATRTRFASGHYADAVESAVKALNELVRARTGRTEDGDSLMTIAFSPSQPLLRIGKGTSKSEESRQRGHMQLCQGAVAAAKPSCAQLD